MKKRLLGCLMAAMVLAGCSTAPQKPEMAEPVLSGQALEQAWSTNHARAKSIDKWQVSGRAGVKTKAKSGVVSINWDNKPEAFSIYMSGPLGQTLARLEGEGDTVILDVPGQEPTKARTAEDLLYRQTGWWLPFSSLKYWMRGIPAPGKDYVRTLNPQGYLAELKQDGWRIVFGSYRDVSGVQLPEKIRAERDGVSVILSIREWTLSSLNLVMNDS
ncbi:lipoprotein insertase outer membrane protein LolB [Sansalvadorimonas sp. 2012CJ34-2]|uniref:Outer-membrane lipoprotein LolB n=1 Tax=Parendozoicomonas callyspongiae TaxID=2942213 RepID=A0ABT0PG36_9GAMM|nr:lipoprotein insertase outer membrane protein LolB [Sansalvadorimonas sp. 2012CJ34-2]MCL6270342.1 lipoprotein insertase outer membrane protein LolB [Sansalvadorimonas sp. 2012CJ34-2]